MARSDSLADLRFALVGSGRLGIALAAALRLAGAELTGHTSRSRGGRERGAAAFGMPAAVSLEGLAAEAARKETHLYVLAVPDDALPMVARELAAALAAAEGDATPAALHTSGATPVDVLAPLAALGLLTFSFHPLQTFSDGAGPERLQGVTVAVTAIGAAAALGFRLALAIGARPFVLREKDRVLYHAAACVASNYLVALEHLAEDLFTRAGLAPEEALPAFMPLVEGTVDNIRRHGTVAALTGPLSRGDTGTIRRHLQTLALQAPEAVDPYRAMGRSALELVRARRAVPEATIHTLDDLLAQEPPAAQKHDDPTFPLHPTRAAEPTPEPGPPPPRRSR